MKRNARCIVLDTAWCSFCVVMVVLLVRCAAIAQETLERGGFVSWGVAPILSGDIPGARQNALVDAQRKSIIAAIGALVPAPVLVEKMSIFEQRFFQQPELFIERFKIIQESALPHQYRIAVQAFMQQDLLNRELVALGLLQEQKEQRRILVLVAERLPDHTEDLCWWTAGASTSAQGYAQPLLSELLTEAGFEAVGGKPLPAGMPEIPCAEISPDEAPRFGSAAGAAYVLPGRAVFAMTDRGDVQCTITVRLIDAATRETLVQAAAYGLGRQDSSRGAVNEAAAVACLRLVEQLTGILLKQPQEGRIYTIRLLFTRKTKREDVRQCMDAFRSVWPGLEVLDMSGDEQSVVWTVQAKSTAPSAAALQEMFGNGVPGYVSRIISASDQTITMRVTPIKR